MYPICFFLFIYFCFKIKVLLLTVRIYFAVPAFGLTELDRINAGEDVEIGKSHDIARLSCD
jgi:hypothetical protein